MGIITNLFHSLYVAECEALEKDEEYQTAKDARNELEKNFVMGLTRKQRVLFHQYREQQDALTDIEFRRLLSRCSILLSVKRE